MIVVCRWRKCKLGIVLLIQDE